MNTAQAHSTDVTMAGDMPVSTQTHKPYVRCYLGLGGNITNDQGTPIEHITRTIAALRAHPDIMAVKASSLYASTPMGPQDQPDFINAVIGFETRLSADEVLQLCWYFEGVARRVRRRRWGRRSLDVDVLWYDNQSINTERLIVPHAGITERNFVLVPLLEIAPNIHINGVPIDTLPLSHDWHGLKKITPDAQTEDQ